MKNFYIAIDLCNLCRVKAKWYREVFRKISPLGEWAPLLRPSIQCYPLPAVGWVSAWHGLGMGSKLICPQLFGLGFDLSPINLAGVASLWVCFGLCLILSLCLSLTYSPCWVAISGLGFPFVCANPCGFVGGYMQPIGKGLDCLIPYSFTPYKCNQGPRVLGFLLCAGFML